MGWTPATASAMLLPATPQTAAAFFGVWKAGRDPPVDVRPVRRRGHPPPASVTQGRRCCSPTPRTPGRIDRSRWSSTCWILDDELLGARLDGVRPRRHRGRRCGPAVLLVGHDGAGEGHPPRPPDHPRPRGVHLLPRPARRGAASTAWASGRGRPGSARCSVRGVWGAVQAVYQREGGFDPAQGQLDFLSRHGVSKRVRHADRDSVDDVDLRRLHPLPAEVPDRVLGRRAAQSRRRSAGSASSTGSPCSTTMG